MKTSWGKRGMCIAWSSRVKPRGKCKWGSTAKLAILGDVQVGVFYCLRTIRRNRASGGFKGDCGTSIYRVNSMRPFNFQNGHRLINVGFAGGEHKSIHGWRKVDDFSETSSLILDQQWSIQPPVPSAKAQSLCASWDHIKQNKNYHTKFTKESSTITTWNYSSIIGLGIERH
jgi:hypothetical protein